MSVNYKAFYGYGFELTDEDVFNLEPNKYDLLVDSDYTQFLNGYDDSRHCFFGIQLISLNEGGLCDIPPIMSIDCADLIQEYVNIFGKKPAVSPTYFIGFVID